MEQKMRGLILRCEVLRAMQMTFLWVVTPCGLLWAEGVYPTLWCVHRAERPRVNGRSS
jgi:hypothetical protein